jgi:hypothetical protein
VLVRRWLVSRKTSLHSWEVDMNWEQENCDDTDVALNLYCDGATQRRGADGEYYTECGWIWIDNRRIEQHSGYRAVIAELPDKRDCHTFPTLEEAKAWLVAAMVYYRITGELAPSDIHKEDV